MKPQTRIYFLALLCFATLGISAFAASPEKAQFLSAHWLRQGCVSIIVAETTPKSFTKEQEALALSVSTWLNGFIAGANSMCLVKEGNDKDLSLTYPPNEWLDPRKLAPKILSFLDSHPEIPPSANSREVIMAFYYSTHPKATGFQSAVGSLLIEKMSKK